MVGHGIGPADRAKENGIVGFDLFAPVIRHHLTVFFVVIARAEFEFIKHQIEVKNLCRGLKHANAFGHDFGADAVAGDDCDFVGGACHSDVLLMGVIGYQAIRIARKSLTLVRVGPVIIPSSSVSKKL